MMEKSNRFYGPHVDLNGVLLRWDNYTCLISSISQLWIGKSNEKKWGMATEAEDEGLYIELNSGSVHFFISSSHDFLVQVYELLCQIAADGRSELQYTIDFKKNLVELPEKTEEIEELPIPSAETINPGSHSAKQELLILIEHYKKKKNPESIVLKLLEEIFKCFNEENRRELPELYKSFVQLSLINDCNELGLNLLISEVKANIYG